MESLVENLVDSSAGAGEDSNRLFDLLTQGGWDHAVVEHSPVYTIEDAMAAVPYLDGIKTKNVFVRDAKGSRHMLVVVPHDKRIDLSNLARVLPSTKLSMGSAERLHKHLGVTSGAVSLFAMMNNADKSVELIIDETVWNAAKVQGHPLRNTATVSITHATLAVFLSRLGHVPRVLRVP